MCAVCELCELWRQHKAQTTLEQLTERASALQVLPRLRCAHAAQKQVTRAETQRSRLVAVSRSPADILAGEQQREEEEEEVLMGIDQHPAFAFSESDDEDTSE